MSTLRARWFAALLLTLFGVVLGLAGAYAYSKQEDVRYGARVALVAQTGTQPVTGGVLHTIADLVRTDIVAQNVIRNQGLTESSETFFKRTHVSVAGSVITVAVTDGDQTKAISIAQELSLVFTQLVRDRFGSASTSAQVSIFDPAHGVGKVSPRTRRDLEWGALFGVLLGLLLANVLVLRGRRGVWMPVAYESLPALSPATAFALPAAPPVSLGEHNDEIADALVSRAIEDHFQTLLVAGDPTGRVSAGVAQALTQRGAGMSIWIRSADVDSEELDRLAARCAFVLVASPEFDPEFARIVDAVVAVTDGASVPNWPGVRLVGTIPK